MRRQVGEARQIRVDAVVVARPQRDLDQLLQRVLLGLRAGVLGDRLLQIVARRVVVAGREQRLTEQDDRVVVGAGVRVLLDDVEQDGRRLLVVLEAQQHLRVEHPAVGDVGRRGRRLPELQQGHVDPLIQVNQLLGVVLDVVRFSGRTEETHPAERERGD